MATKSYLAEFDADVTDERLVCAIAKDLLRIEPAPPYKLAYKYINPNDAPPYPCDMILTRAALCCVERNDKAYAREWIKGALMAGQYVQRFSRGAGYREPIASGSIKSARETIAMRIRMADFDAKRTINPDIDDEIPF